MSEAEQKAIALMRQGQTRAAYDVLRLALAQNGDVKDLRLFIVLGVQLGLLNEAKQANLELKKISSHDPSYYFFSGLIAEKEGREIDAIESYKVAFHLSPQNAKPLQDALRLLQKRGEMAQYQISADVAFCTGGYFFNKKFNPNTLHTEGLGGSESALIYVAREWARLGKKVVVFCNCDVPGVYDGVTYRPIQDFEICHSINSYSLVIALRIANHLAGDLNPKARQILWLQDAPNTALYQPPFRADGQRIDEFFVLSRYHKESWRDFFQIPEEKFFITRNGFDPQIFSPQDQRRMRIMYASRPERGLKEAVLVFQKLKAEFPDLELALCTYTQNENIFDDPAIKEVAEFLTQPGVTFLGSLSKSRFADELKQCRLLFHPNVLSYVETSCIAAIEAQACGVPVICGRGGAMEETVQNGRTGVVIDFGQDREVLIHEMAQAARALLTDSDRWQEMSKNACTWMNSQYRWEQIAQAWLKHLS